MSGSIVIVRVATAGDILGFGVAAGAGVIRFPVFCSSFSVFDPYPPPPGVGVPVAVVETVVEAVEDSADEDPSR